jgi:pyruvate dehydrogenase E2 component (dihydrolipoamide acetyltransferase)
MTDSIAIPMPKVSSDMKEAILLEWHVQEGDVVIAGDVLFEIETDKATFEIESERDGTIERILVEEGTTVAVDTPVATIRP